MEIEPDPNMKRDLPNILITGTPGVGKTTLAKLLVGYLQNIKYLAVADIITKEKLYKEWDHKFNCSVFDDDLVVDYLEPLMQKGGLMLEFHTSGFFPERWFDLIVLLRTDNTKLYDRLKERGYDQPKIEENIQCEIMQVTRDEVRDSYKKEIILQLKSDV